MDRLQKERYEKLSIYLPKTCLASCILAGTSTQKGPRDMQLPQWAGGAVVAIGAVAALGCLCRLEDGGVVFLGLGGMQVVEVGQQLVGVVDAEYAGGDAGLGKTVGYALLGGEGDAEGRSFLVEQAAATAEGFHDGDRDMVGGAIVVELNTHGVDAGLEVVHGTLVPRGGTTTEAVESGVEREHDDFNPAAACSHERHFGVVAADTNVLDFAFFLELENIVEVGAAFQFVPLLGAIGDVNHAHFDVVGAQTLEEVFETLLGFLEVAGAGVLPVLENGADMGLDNHAVAAAFEGCTDVGAGFGVGIVDVDVVDAAIQCHVHQGNGASRIEFFESTTAYADFTYRKACVAQWAVGHGVLRGVLASHLHECERQKGKG